MTERMPFVLVVVLYFSILPLTAQNLVVNGGFEAYYSCPSAIGNLSNDSKHLKAPTIGSTDYFNICGAKEVSIPKNFNGTQATFEGKAYAGLYLLSPNDYREYIQFELKEKLEKGKYYKVSLRLSLAEISTLAIQEASVLFTQDALKLETNQNLSPRRLDRFKVAKFSYVKLKVTRTIFDSEAWSLVEAEFEAKGYEKYLTFGNFKDDRYSRTIRLDTKENNQKALSYYYIDDVSVSLSEKQQFELNKPFVLNQLQFEFDDFKLTEKAKTEVEKVYAHLRRNPKVQLEIYGHTDDLGSENYNKYLSSRRARSVALYLQELGLSEERITWEGKGDKAPLHIGTSDKERNANRRVEFVITKFEDH
ncbi:OmpA family protein [Croceitalea rosinachiae]|uniref:OmpA family protein n=1 Tax=Croceitalea rosinachiae TaxID=3075596 RepID=A0ABU3AD21_9FLAO|nr:OmpA family protein [Croceitalea sp. F388]MDT0608074.1 OmpA family protein [Croceitalea sp. F388]